MTKKEIEEMAITQLNAWAKFQKERYGAVTILDFDTWVGGYVSGISKLLIAIEKPETEEEVVKLIKNFSGMFTESELAKSIGIKSTLLEEIQFVNIAKL